MRGIAVCKWCGRPHEYLDDLRHCPECCDIARTRYMVLKEADKDG
jgi:hypothetical protein